MFFKELSKPINDYRIEAVKKRSEDPKSSRFSLLGVAYECGFDSETSFYRIFKSAAGMSPKEICKDTIVPASDAHFPVSRYS
ncbi:MAG: AraC family transcriptional regulator [Williamsia sp.]|nr:AraC family transcriptional regulator [Williamsia sp.]